MYEKFSLKWNDFNTNASKSFGIFRNEDYLHDVTLVSDDQNQVRAHKLVLSASSEYFKNIFKNNKHSNPFLCLDGISSIDLNNILDYIYNGEVQVYYDNVDKFLEVAQRFKLEGLLGVENNDEVIRHNLSKNLTEDEVRWDDEEVREEQLIPEFDPPSKTRKEEIPKKEYTIIEKTSIQSINTQILQIDADDLEELDQKLLENMVKIAGGYSCNICSKRTKLKSDMKVHVETHMEGLSFPCNTCGNEFRSRDSLRSHIYKHKQHKLKRVKVKNHYQTKDQTNLDFLDIHVQSNHLDI